MLDVNFFSGEKKISEFMQQMNLYVYEDMLIKYSSNLVYIGSLYLTTGLLYGDLELKIVKSMLAYGT